MAQINLLPWRERLREERKRQFLSVMAGVLVISAGLVLLADRQVSRQIQNQQARNQFLAAEIAILDAQVAEISHLQEQKREIEDRMIVIQNLQGSRPVIVHVFDELVKNLPDGVYFESLERFGDLLNLVGVAESYGQLTTLMRRLDGSEWFTNPDLRIISATDGEGFSDTAANRFTLKLTLVPDPGQQSDGSSE